jgi:hypothetical protein
VTIPLNDFVQPMFAQKLAEQTPEKQINKKRKQMGFSNSYRKKFIVHIIHFHGCLLLFFLHPILHFVFVGREKK